MAIESHAMDQTTNGSTPSLQNLSNIPEELIFEILLRLPVKSLLRFRCVSKSWLSLLSCPQFCKTHFNFTIKNRNTSSYRLALLASVPDLGRVCSVYSVGCKDSSVNVARLDYPQKLLAMSLRIVGSCNGLICLTAASFAMITLNPSTGKSKEFPDSLVQNRRGVGCFVRYGFGYDASMDDYKVVKIFSFAQTEGKHENIVKVYSLRDNSWKTIESFPSVYISGHSGVFVSGALHWEACQRHGSFAWEIVTFDLAAETYGKIMLPSYGRVDVYWTLGASEGKLVACCICEPNEADLWVMKEYGVEKSWTKLVSINLHIRRRGYIRPLFVSENGDEVLLKLGTYLMLYNSKDTSFKQLDIYASGACREREVQAATYFESL